MRPIHVMLILMALLAAACSLSGDAGSDPVEPVVLTPLPPTVTTEVTEPAGAFATATLRPTSTPQPTPRPISNNPGSSGAQNPTRSACTVRADWPLYSVVSGDTLSNIARRINSTVSELSTANCLANANAITVGQNLRVPRLPQTPTPTPSPLPGASILTWRAMAASEWGPNSYTLEWQTRGAASVRITIAPPNRGPGISLGTLQPDGTTRVQNLDVAVFAPQATLTLILQDANGYDLIGSNGQVVSSSIVVSVAPATTVPTTFTTDTPTIARGGLVRLRWNVPNALYPLAITRLAVDPYSGGEVIATNLPASGTFEAQIPDIYTASVSFMLNGVNPNGHGGDYGYVSVAILPSPTPECPDGVPQGMNPVTIEPLAGSTETCVELIPNGLVTVRFPAAESRRIAFVEFYFLPSSGPYAGNPNVIGTDQNAADGLSISWQVPGGPLAGTVYAFAYGVESSQSINSDPVGVFAR